MPKIAKISLLALSVLLVLALFLGVNVHGVRAVSAQSQQEGAYRQINVYGEVLQHVQNDYVVDPNMPAVTNGALRGLLESLDADSSYLTAADYKIYKANKGGKGQLGIYVSKRFGYATVVSVVPGSPADKADLSDGDIIEAIAGQDTRDLSLAVIKLMLEGAPGSEAKLAVIRRGKASPDPDPITLNRVVISEPNATETLYENQTIVDLQPVILDHEHVSSVEKQLKAFDKSGSKKVLLDLRDVSGGDPAEGVRLANFFLKSGTITTLEGQKVPKQTFGAEPAKALNTTSPLVILVNHGTSGAAEIVASAIADNKRGDLVGEKTFGEGAQQKTFELTDGSALILSVAKYKSPAGKTFEDEGVTPGTLVASAAAADTDEDSAPAPTTTDTATRNAPKAPKPQVSRPDDQLNKALEMLKAKSA